MNALKISLLLLITILLNSCFEYDDVEFKGFNNFKMGKIKEGKVTFDIDATLFNPNAYAISVKPSRVDIYVEDEYIGIGTLLKKVKMKRKSTAPHAIPLEIELQNGAMFKLMRFIAKKEITITIKGKVKGAVYGISKNFDVNEKKTISTRDFKNQ